MTAGAAWGQSEVSVRLDTNWKEAVVYADTVRIGRAADQSTFVVPRSTKRIRLLPPASTSWSIRPVSASLPSAPEDTVGLTLDFPYHYHVESVPYGATVYLRKTQGARQALGRTPLLYRSDEPIQHPVVVDEPGYRLEEIEPDSSIWNDYYVELNPATEGAMGGEAARVDWDPPNQYRTWIDIAAVGLAVSAASYSIYNKFRADRLYEDYQETGSPDLRSQIKSYDTRAAVGLGVMQVGLGVFAIRLVLR